MRRGAGYRDIAMMKLLAVSRLLLLLLLLGSCQKNSYELEPILSFSPSKRLIECLPSAFPPLSSVETDQQWAKELRIGNHFAKELDLYRAVTAYKRARILAAGCSKERLLQLDYCILFAYYLGGKFQEVVETFEASDLVSADPSFPAFGDLLVVLYDAYSQDGRCERAEAVLELIDKYSSETKADLQVYQSVVDGNVARARLYASQHPKGEKIFSYLDSYCCSAKSVKRAQLLNACIPGAGYYYVGQKQTALTSFLLNTLFTAAALYFFEEGNIPMGVILTSLETGWYFGGINGAGLAAKEYNERFFEKESKELLQSCKLFPALLFEYSF